MFAKPIQFFLYFALIAIRGPLSDGAHADWVSLVFPENYLSARDSDFRLHAVFDGKR